MAESTTSARIARQIFLRAVAGKDSSSEGDELDAMADHMASVFFDAGELIYERGEPPDHMYFIVRGNVELVGEGEPWKLSDRALIGVLDAQLGRPRARTAVAMTRVHALRLLAEDYFELLEDNFERLRTIFERNVEGVSALVVEAGPSGGFEPTGGPTPDDRLTSLAPLNPIERISTLRALEAFSRSSIQALVRLSKACEQHFVERGPFRLFPGGKARRLVVVARGYVELERDDPPLSARFGPCALAGGFAALGDPQPFARISALGPGVLLSLRLEDLLDIMEDHFELSRSVMRHLALERERLMLLRGPPPR